MMGSGVRIPLAAPFKSKAYTISIFTIKSRDNVLITKPSGRFKGRVTLSLSFHNRISQLYSILLSQIVRDLALLLRLSENARGTLSQATIPARNFLCLPSLDGARLRCFSPVLNG